MLQYTAFEEKRVLYKEMFKETKLMKNLLEKIVDDKVSI